LGNGDVSHFWNLRGGDDNLDPGMANKLNVGMKIKRVGMVFSNVGKLISNVGDLFFGEIL
jgi:hypothetical protein